MASLESYAFNTHHVEWALQYEMRTDPLIRCGACGERSYTWTKRHECFRWVAAECRNSDCEVGLVIYHGRHGVPDFVRRVAARLDIKLVAVEQSVMATPAHASHPTSRAAPPDRSVPLRPQMVFDLPDMSSEVA